MRIISGTAGRRNFRVPNASKVEVRPTTDRTREALFSMLAHLVDGAKVLDLFAGSGGLGLESLSRGAESCVFVDENRACTNTVSLNLKTLRLDGGKVIQADVMNFINKVSLSQYDLIFTDPPYHKYPGDRDFVAEMFALDDFRNLLTDEGMLIVEADERAEIAETEGWELIEKRKYGGCSIHLFQKS